MPKKGESVFTKGVWGGQPGIGIDAQGGQVIDPTKNVEDLVRAEVKRLNDLADLRDKHAASVLEQQAQRDTERRYYEDKLRDSDKELRKAESDRIDAIRAVDVGNVQRAAEVAGAQAEALRTTVAATAVAFDAKIVAVLDPIQKDIADLRRAQYEAQGQKTQVVESHSGSAVATTYIAIAISLLFFLVAVASLAVAVVSK